MANEEHLARFKQGVAAWNQWRRAQPQIKPDLSGAHLDEDNLRIANLSGIDLHDADLSEAHLPGWMPSANLQGANLYYAQLHGVCLTEASLRSANLLGANLSNAMLCGADLHLATLYAANLSEADLTDVNLSYANLSGANLSHAVMAGTLLGALDLREVQGLETVRHQGSSDIGLQTIYQSEGKIPEVFLRGAGVPASFIEAKRFLVNQHLSDERNTARPRGEVRRPREPRKPDQEQG